MPIENTFDIARLVRPNILRVKPYSSARTEFTGEAEVFLDANENAFGSPAGRGHNRYPDPLQKELKAKIAAMNGISPASIFIGNGSDEAIDLLFRVFCEPGRDEVIICPPTYGMYEVCAEVNDVRVQRAPLTHDFQLDTAGVLNAVTPFTKLVFLCSPNNPTGNLMCSEDVVEIALGFPGIVVVDEAYIQFSSAGSATPLLEELPNIVVLQTFSKAWAMAGIRVGTAFSDPCVIDLLNRVKPPYNVSSIAQTAALEGISNYENIQAWIIESVRERDRLSEALKSLPFVQQIYTSDANFILVKMNNPNAVYEHLIGDGIVVRNRDNVEHCEGCLRITVGTQAENSRLLESLDAYREDNSDAAN